MKIDYAALSDTGQVRNNNEDFFGAVISDTAATNSGNEALFVVADGMGGHKGGEIASKIAVDTIIEFFRTSRQDDKVLLLSTAFSSANSAIIANSVADTSLFGMGTTCTAMIINDKVAYFGHVGDSRAYRVREKVITQVTDDHSLVAEMVRSGMITEDDARQHPKRNVITRSLGSQGAVETDAPQSPMQLRGGDVFVLCSDGLTGCVTDEEIGQLAVSGDVESACRKLIDLANERGGRDNITVQIVRVFD